MAALTEWAARWGIPPQAIDELCRMALYCKDRGDNASEARIQNEIRLAAARKGWYLFRNNSGAGKLASGNFVRFGLGNDSPAANDAFKSGDLIGWRRELITPAHVGRHIAQFFSAEVKSADWKFSGTKEEIAQISWQTLVNAQGGCAIVTNTHESIENAS